MERKLNPRGRAIFKTYPNWKNSRVQRAALPARAGRHDTTAAEKRGVRTKAASLSDFHRQIRRDSKCAVLDDVTVKLAPGCRLKSSDLPAPFRQCTSGWNALRLVVPSLDIAAGIKKESLMKKPLGNFVFLAALLGRRLCSPEYIAKVSEWIRNREEGMGHAHKLPPSVKLQA